MPEGRRLVFDLNLNRLLAGWHDEFEYLAHIRLRCRQGLRPARIENANATGDDHQHFLAIEPGQRSTHCLDRQAQKIRNVLPAHRQPYCLPIATDADQPIAPADQESRNLLLGGASPEQKHLIVGQC